MGSRIKNTYLYETYLPYTESITLDNYIRTWAPDFQTQEWVSCRTSYTLRWLDRTSRNWPVIPPSRPHQGWDLEYKYSEYCRQEWATFRLATWPKMEVTIWNTLLQWFHIFSFLYFYFRYDEFFVTSRQIISKFWDLTQVTTCCKRYLAVIFDSNSLCL